MYAVVIKPTPKGPKIFRGKLLQNGMMVSLVVTNKNGTESIKQFQRADVIVKIPN